jgi:hypothetical protein
MHVYTCACALKSCIRYTRAHARVPSLTITHTPAATPPSAPFTPPWTQTVRHAVRSCARASRASSCWGRTCSRRSRARSSDTGRHHRRCKNERRGLTRLIWRVTALCAMHALIHTIRYVAVIILESDCLVRYALIHTMGGHDVGVRYASCPPCVT